MTAGKRAGEVLGAKTKIKRPRSAAGKALSQPRQRPCIRCGKPGRHTWSGCCLNNAEFSVCDKCDLDLNETFLKFLGFPNWKEIMDKYKVIRN